MNALVFGGESPRHAEWVQHVQTALEPDFGEVRALHYKHWTEGGIDIDLEYKIGQAAQLAEGLDDYVIVAKSIGTVVAALTCGRNILHPKRCVMLGFPLRLVIDRLSEAGRALATLPSTAFVQNEYHKVGTGRALRSYLDEIEPAHYSLEIIHGNDTHDYTDFEHITQLAPRV